MFKNEWLLIMQFKFPKKDYNGDRKKRRAERVSKKKVKPESLLQKQANQIYNSLGIKSLRVPDDVFSFINSCRYLPKWFKIFFNVNFAGWSDNILLLRNGKFICIELKTETGKININQKQFRAMVGEDNFYICRSVEDIYSVLFSYGVRR